MKRTSESSSGRNLFFRLGNVVEDCKKEYETICAASRAVSLDDIVFSLTDDVSFPRETAQSTFPAAGQNGNLLVLGDNLDFMRWLLLQKNMRGALRLIYIDPPFFSGADYKASLSMGEKKESRVCQQAYGDTWSEGLEEYLRMLTLRLLFMRDLLADNGVIWVHLDWHVAHCVRLILDELFGAQCFVNEVIWSYKSGGAGSRHFARKHDTLLFYAKGEDYYFEPQKEKSYNRNYKPYRFQGVQEYEDELGWYTLVNRRDVWQIDMVGRTAAERTGYATQKPEALLETIIKSCTKEGDLCADFFSGSGTLAAVAGKLGRRFLCCDAGNLAVSTAMGRLAEAGIPVLRGEISREKSANTKQKGKNAGRVRLGVAGERDEQSVREERQKIRIILKRCGLPGREVGLPGARREELKKLLRKEPLALVRFWAVDSDYDGHVFRPCAFFCRGKAGMETECVLPVDIERERRRIAVKVCDVFGIEMLTILE